MVRPKARVRLNSFGVLTGAWRLRGAFGGTARKGAMSLAEQSVASGANFLTTVLIGRFCGPTELGLFFLGFTVVILILGVQEALITAPYTVYANRLGQDQRAEYAGAVLLQVGLLAAFAAACLASAAAVLGAGFGPPGLGRVVAVLAFAVPFVLVRELCRRLAYAHLNVRQALAVSVAAATVQLFGLLWLAAEGALAAHSAFVLIGVGSAAAAVAWIAYNHTLFRMRWERFPQTVWRNWILGR